MLGDKGGWTASTTLWSILGEPGRRRENISYKVPSRRERGVVHIVVGQGDSRRVNADGQWHRKEGPTIAFPADIGRKWDSQPRRRDYG